MPRTLLSTDELSLRKQTALNIGKASIYSKWMWQAINWDISFQSGFVSPGFQFRLVTSFQNYLLKCYLLNVLEKMNYLYAYSEVCSLHSICLVKSSSWLCQDKSMLQQNRIPFSRKKKKKSYFKKMLFKLW